MVACAMVGFSAVFAAKLDFLIHVSSRLPENELSVRMVVGDFFCGGLYSTWYSSRQAYTLPGTVADSSSSSTSVVSC